MDYPLRREKSLTMLARSQGRPRKQKTLLNAHTKQMMTRIWEDLRSRNPNTRSDAARNLRSHVERQSRDLPPELLETYIEELNGRILQLIGSGDIYEKLGGILAIDGLVHILGDTNETKMIRFANYLRQVFQHSGDYAEYALLLSHATKALGRLVRAGGALSADIVESEAKQALEWLVGDRSESRRHAAILVFKELAENTPTLCASYIDPFLERVWSSLRDPSPVIRTAASRALRSCLILVAQRNLERRTEVYTHLFAGILNSFNSKNQDSIHAGMLALGELLRNSGDFMRTRFLETCSMVLQYKGHRSRLVRETVISLIPQLASYSPKDFVSHHFSSCLDHIIQTLKTGYSRPVGYLALGEIALAVGKHLEPKLDVVVDLLKEGLTQLRLSSPNSALTAVSMLARAVGTALVPYTKELLDEMFANGLTWELVEALVVVSTHIRAAKHAIEDRLLAAVAAIIDHSMIDRKSDSASSPSAHDPRRQASSGPSSAAVARTAGLSQQGLPEFNAAASKSDTQSLLLALRTLATFKFDSHNMLPFVNDVLMFYLSSDIASVRRQVVVTCGVLLKSHLLGGVEILQSRKPSARPVTQSVCSQDNRSFFGFQSPFVSPLDTPAVSEHGNVSPAESPYVQVGSNKQASHVGQNGNSEQSGVPSLALGPPLMPHTFSVSSHIEEDKQELALIQAMLALSTVEKRAIAETLRRLLTFAISDPDQTVRIAVVAALGPHFDPFLAQAEMVHSLAIALNDEDFEVREAVLVLMGRLSFRNPSHVMLSLRKCLIQLLTEIQYGGENRAREESTMLLQHLITSSPKLVRPYVGPILNVLVPRLKDENSTVASLCLCVCGSLAMVSGDGVDMLQNMDTLVTVILDTLKDKNSTVKKEVTLRSLGQLFQSTGMIGNSGTEHRELLPVILNSLKPSESWPVRREAMKLLGIIGALDPSQQRLDSRKVNADPPTSEDSMASGKFELQSGAYKIFSEEYCPTVAITALMQILCESTLSQHHSKVIQAVMFIFKSLGQQGLPPFLSVVIPQFLATIRGPDDTLKETLFNQMGVLVGIVKGHIRPYLDDILKVVSENWEDERLAKQVLALVEQIAVVLQDDFNFYIPLLLPQLVRVLDDDVDQEKSVSLTVLRMLDTFGSNLEGYLHIVISAILRLFEDRQSNIQVRIVAVRTLGRLGRILNLTDYASRLIHPLARSLESVKGTMSFQTKQVGHTGNGLASTGTTLVQEVLETLCVLLHQLQGSYLIFAPMVAKVLSNTTVHTGNLDVLDHYYSLVAKLESRQNLTPQDLLPPKGIGSTGLAVGAGVSAATNQMNEQEEGSEIKNKLGMRQDLLARAWGCSQRSTPEDWKVWLRGLSMEMLKQSPSPALRACSSLAQKYVPLAQSLFYAAFASCWAELFDFYRDDLIRNLEIVFVARNVPHDILQTLLNLAEFMEQDEHGLPIGITTLGSLAEKCHAYAKALHYKELEFESSPDTTIEALISINNQLGQPEASVGILTYAQQRHHFHLKESWFEALHRWEDALEAYERKQLEVFDDIETMVSRMRCLLALGEWSRLLNLARQAWNNPRLHEEDLTIRQQVANLACTAGWNLGHWDIIPEYLSVIDETNPDCHFFRAILALRENNFSETKRAISETRKLLDPTLTAMIGESYSRAYTMVVKLQQLTEMEEIILYKSSDSDKKKALIRKMWTERLKGCQHNVDVWQPIFAVRSLVVDPVDDVPTWLKFSSLCQKSGRQALSLKVLTNLLGFDPRKIAPGIPANHKYSRALPPHLPRVSYAYVKHIWAAGFRREAFARLRLLVRCIEDERNTPVLSDMELGQMKARLCLRLGIFQLALEHSLRPDVISQVLASFERATEHDPTSYKCWHNWAVMNFRAVSFYKQQKSDQSRGLNVSGTPNTKSTAMENDLRLLNSKINQHLVPAITGFFKSVERAGDKSLQDILRLLTLWFAHGSQKEVEEALVKGFNTLSINTWLPVIPQIIARIHTSQSSIRRMIHQLLCKVGKKHPQALVYPLAVVSQSENNNRKATANDVMNSMRQHSPVLVEQALTVSRELIRVAILWHEMWYEALEEASRQWFRQRDVDGMFAALAPLHEILNKGPQTAKEVAFTQAYGRELKEALDLCRKYSMSGNERDLNQAWDLYCIVFRKINKILPQITDMELADVSTKLVNARNLELVVPGTYLDEKHQPIQPLVTISYFHSAIKVIESKQRPRKLSMMGSDGINYAFVLKGHEDLRQDERVMQLFGLVNTLLANSRETSKKNLQIRGYAVIPLSPTSGVIQWLPHCDTMHAMVKEYRDSKKILLNIEHRLMLHMAPDYQSLSLMQKVEVLEHALSITTGRDLAHVLWLKSQNSEQWLERRNNYTRSLAIMSMVGYILGLGDRHPCNLMLDRYSGKIIHIDFGDCFEVAMHREKFPEKIPFRLTRMLVNAMEVSGLEGNYRSTAESVMNVLRTNSESVMAVGDVFPLFARFLLTFHIFSVITHSQLSHCRSLKRSCMIRSSVGGS